LKADVIPSTWPDHMVLAYLAADNELSRGSDPDREQLALLVAEVGAIDDQLGELAAGSEAEVLALQKLLEEQGHAPDPRIDQADALREQWGVEAGQLWTVQSKSRPGVVHRILCGDATDPLAATRLLGDRRPALMVTDPPYGVELDHSWRTIALDNKESERGGQLLNDDRADWSEIYPLYGAPVIYAWHASRFTDVVKAGLEAQGYQVRQMIIWVKKSAALSRSAYHWQHEPCWYAVLRERLGPRRAVSALLSPQRAVYQDGHRAAWYAVRGGKPARWLGGRRQTTCWFFDSPLRSDAGTLHPTQKPVELYTIPIRNHTTRGDVVVDPFSGSGTLIVACEQVQRAACCMELDPRWVAVTLQVLFDMGLNPELEHDNLE